MQVSGFPPKEQSMNIVDGGDPPLAAVARSSYVQVWTSGSHLLLRGRMASITLLDDATRPKAPRIGGLTATQRARGTRLAVFHRMHLQQLGQVQRVLAQVEASEAGAGAAEAARLGTAISALDMAQNYKLFGNLCGHECQMLTFHHTAEDQALFPVLQARGTEGLRKVVDRLQAEHLVVHNLIEELEAAALHLMRNPDAAGFADVKARFLTLDKVVRSHFGYEETELEEALGFLGIEF